MFFIFKGKKWLKLTVILSSFLLTALVAVIISFFSFQSIEKPSRYIFDLDDTGGVSGFLSQFSLEYESLLHKREVTLPEKDDSVFADFGDFQENLGFNVLKFSGKKVEERYLKLKNKSKKGESVYAVVYIYKNRVISAYLTTFLEGAETLSLTAFG